MFVAFLNHNHPKKKGKKKEKRKNLTEDGWKCQKAEMPEREEEGEEDEGRAY
jgi:hypothetical protein